MTNDVLKIREVLEEIGYSLQESGNNYRTTPLYRESDNKGVLSIDKKTGKWFDFKTEQRGDLGDLIKITLGLSDKDEALKKFNVSFSTNQSEKIYKIIQPKTFNKDLLKNVKKNHTYWIKRGVSKETLNLFGGGTVDCGLMKGRYVFPIYNSINQLSGISGRLTYKNDKAPKWKHKGNVSTWVYPLSLNQKEIEKKGEVLLVESIGDLLSLWEAGAKNVLVAFGLSVSNEMVNYFLGLNPKAVYVCFNNDENGAGQTGAYKAYKKLNKFFPNVKIKYPDKNDFGEMNQNEIKLWLRKNKIE